MAGRSRKLSLADEKTIAKAVGSGVSVADLAEDFSVTRPTVYRAIKGFGEKQVSAKSGNSAVSFTVDRGSLLAFDAFVRQLGLKSRADAFRRVCRVPAAFLEPDPELSGRLRDLTGQLNAIGRNVNQLVATKNYEIRRGQQLKLNVPQQRLLSDLLEHIDGVSTVVREIEGRRASRTILKFVAGMTGTCNGAT